MKKKFLTILLTVATMLMCIFGITACKDNDDGGSLSSETGVYYLYENDTYNKSDYYELLSGNEWRDKYGETGTYSVSGSAITFYYTIGGETEELFDGTISDGVIYIADLECYYCKEDKTPSGNGGQTEAQYTVTYNANGGTFEGGETTLTVTVKDNATLTAPDSPTRTNYTFAGWATNGTGSNKWNFSTDKVTGDITLYATWSQKSAAVLSVDGASIDGLNIFMLVDKNTDSVSLAGKVVCSDDSVWKLYYDKLGQVEIPTKIAADISGELLDGDNLFYMVVSSQDGVQVNVYELNVHRSYAIDVCYYDGDTHLKTVTAYTGYEFTADYVPNITGYTFNDWNYTPNVLWEDLKLYVDKTANTYTVTYDVNGGDELTTTEKTVTYDSDYRLTKPTKTGYTFLGWYNGETQLTDGNGKSLALWNYAKNLTVKAKWQVNEYAVKLKTNNSSAGTVSGAGDYAYDSNVTITASTNSGYTWLGWYDKDDQLVTSEISYKFKMGFDVTYTAKWSKTAVTKNISAAGSITSLLDKYVSGQEITVTATTYLGYTWLGWYNGDMLLTTETSYTFAMSAENTTYTAKWNVSAGMSNFSFSSSTTTCTISGIKDNTVTEIVVPDYVTIINKGAFSGCGNLTNITVPFVGKTKDDTSKVHFGYIFGASSSSYNDDYVPTSLKKVTVTGGGIAEYAFNGCSSLTSIEIPDSVTSIGNYAFDSCSSLTSIEIPDSVTSIGWYAFNGCVAEIKWGNNPTITSIDGWGFNGYKGTSIAIPDSVISISSGAFYGCSNLESVTLPFIGESESTEALRSTLFGYIFGTSSYTGGTATQQYHNSSSCTTYYIPATLKRVTITGGNILYGAFYNCSSLTSVTIGDNVREIDSLAFYGCSSLTSIEIPDSVTSIGDYAFEGCSNLQYEEYDNAYYLGNENNPYFVLIKVKSTNITSIEINSATKIIASFAFEGCSSLSIMLPNSVTRMCGGAFSDCGLTSIYYKGTEKEFSAIWRDFFFENTTKIYTYSETEPALNDDGTAYDGDYWHYVDGVPTVWGYTIEE